jgi:hypothetical protein
VTDDERAFIIVLAILLPVAVGLLAHGHETPPAPPVEALWSTGMLVHAARPTEA